MAVTLSNQQLYDVRTKADQAVQDRLKHYFRSREDRLKELYAIYGDPNNGPLDSKQRRNIAQGLERSIRNDKYIADTEKEYWMPRLYDKYEKEALAAEEIRVNEENRQKEIADRAQRDAETKAANQKGQDVKADVNQYKDFTPQQLENLRKAEASASSPQFKSAAGITEETEKQIYDYSAYLKDHPEELASIQATAKRTIDPYYDEKQKQMAEQLELKINKFSDTLNALTEKEKLQLGRAIQNLDSDAVKSLSAKFDELAKRGALNSGFVKDFANTIVESRDLEANYQDKLSAINLRISGIEKKYGTDLAQAEGAEKRSDLEKVRLSDITATEEALKKSRAGEYAARQLIERENQKKSEPNPLEQPGSPAAVIRQENFAKKPPSASSYYAPAGSSFDLAKKAAEGSITAAQQRLQRDALMSGSTSLINTKGSFTAPTSTASNIRISSTPPPAPPNLSSSAYTRVGVKPSSRR